MKTPWRVEADERCYEVAGKFTDQTYIAGYNIVDADGAEVIGCEGIIDPDDKRKDNRVSDERLAEMLEDEVPEIGYFASFEAGEYRSIITELQSLRSKPVGVEVKDAIEGLKIVLDAHDEEVRYQASIEGEAAEFWDDIEVKVDDVRVVLAALGAQVSAPTLEPASPQPKAVTEEDAPLMMRLVAAGNAMVGWADLSKPEAQVEWTKWRDLSAVALRASTTAISEPSNG